MSQGAACHGCGAASTREARYCSSCGRPLREQPATELRQVTVVFCDLVGSAALSTRMDPEDFTALIASFHRCVSDVMTVGGGYVARVVGDASMTYFGYPVAREDDAARAVEAGLAAVACVAAIPTLDAALSGSKLRARVGIATGVSVVGDVAGTGDARFRDIAGEAPNLAARLHTQAEPGEVVIDRETRQLTASRFECAFLGPRALKGWDEPVPVWRVLRQAAASDSFAALTAPTFGRDAEQALLSQIWAAARLGAGQVVLLTGEAGVGKSRLVQGFVQTLSRDVHARAAFFGSPHHQGAPLHPLVRRFAETAAFAPDDAPQDRIDKLRASLPQLAPDDFELIAELTASAPGGAASPPGTASLRRERTIRVILGLLEQATAAAPLIGIVEDAHWLDPTSLELVARVAERAAAQRLLLVVTARPEFAPDWAGMDHVHALRLGPLDRAQAREVVRSATGADTLPDAVVDEIVQRCDGVPLYLEEVTKVVVEASSARDGEGAPDRRRGSVVPPSIHASLLARIDSLGPARPLAEMAAAIGREFSGDMLREVAAFPPDEFDAALEAVLRSGLVLRVAGPKDEHLRFKHALIQDAAYGMIVRSRRRELHARIADALGRRFPKVASGNPSVMAHHCTQAGLTRDAVEWRLRAATQSLNRSAVTETSAQLARAMELMQTLPDDERRAASELDLRMIEGKASIAARGHGAPQTGAAFARARAVCERLDRPPQLMTVLFMQWSHAFFSASLPQARRKAEEVLRLGDAQAGQGADAGVSRLLGCYAMGMSLNPAGDLRGSRRFLEEGISLYDEKLRHLYGSPVLADPRVVMRNYVGMAMLCCGDLSGARHINETATAEARKLGQMWALAQSLYHGAFGWRQSGCPAEALAVLEELDELVRGCGFLYYEALATMLRGWCVSDLGEPQHGVDLVERGMAIHDRTTTVLYMPSFKLYQAQVLGRAGRPADGLARLDECATLMHASGAFWDEAEMHRARGELLAACGETERAKASLRLAIEVAERQGAHLFRMRASDALDRLCPGPQPAGRSGCLADRPA